jgi:hypothetical protein
MRHFKLLGAAVAALCMMGIATASTAFALPDISVTLTGASYPLHLEVTLLTVKTKLSNVVKETITGEGILVLYTLTELGHLGTFEALFTHTKKGTEACFSEEGSTKDPSGEILTKGSWHLVYTSLPSGSGLQLGILYLVAPVKIKCGTIEVSVKGNTLSSVDSLTLPETTEFTTLSGILKGNGEGKPNINFFYNEGGTSVKAKLEANFGTGFKEAAEEVEELITVTALAGKMFVVTSQ